MHVSTRLALVAPVSVARLEINIASHRKSRIAFENLHLKFGHFARFPQRRSKFSAIFERPSILRVTAFQRPRNADELGLDSFAGRANNRVSVATHVDKPNV